MKHILSVLITIFLISCHSFDQRKGFEKQLIEPLTSHPEEYTFNLFLDWQLSDEDSRQLSKYYHSKLKRIRFYEKKREGAVCVNQCGINVSVQFLDDHLKLLATEEFSDSYYERSDIWFAIDDEGNLFFYLKGLTRQGYHGRFASTYQINPDFTIMEQGRYYENNSISTKHDILYGSGYGLTYIDQSDIDQSKGPNYSLVYQNELAWDALSVMAERHVKESKSNQSLQQKIIDQCQLPNSEKCQEKLVNAYWSDLEKTYGNPLEPPMVRVWSESMSGRGVTSPKGIIQITERSHHDVLTIKEIGAVKDAWMYTAYPESEIYLYIERLSNDTQTSTGIVDIYKIIDDLSIELDGHYIPKTVKNNVKRQVYALQDDILKKGQKTPIIDLQNGVFEVEDVDFYDNFFQLLVDQQLDDSTSQVIQQHFNIDNQGSESLLTVRVWSAVNSNCLVDCGTELIIQLLDNDQQTLAIQSINESLNNRSIWLSVLNNNDLYLFIEASDHSSIWPFVYCYQINSDFSIDKPSIYYGKEQYASAHDIFFTGSELTTIRPINSIGQSTDISQKHNYKLVHDQRLNLFVIDDMIDQVRRESREKEQANVDEIYSESVGECKDSQLIEYISQVFGTGLPFYNLHMRVWGDVAKQDNRPGGIIQIFDPLYSDDVLYQMNIDYPVKDAWVKYTHYGVINLYIEKSQNVSRNFSPRIVDIYQMQCDFSFKYKGRYIPKTDGIENSLLF